MKIKICDLKDLNLYVTKFVKELRDELIIYKLNGEIFVKSSICPHFGGEIYFCKNKKKLRCKWHD